MEFTNKIGRPKRPLSSVIKVTKFGCWEWQGALRDGYGLIRRSGKTQNAHRYIYERQNGKIPDGLVLDHLCRNRKCVRPNHLEVVTNAENSRRGERPNRSTCKNGHPYSVENLRYNVVTSYRYCLQCSRKSKKEYQRRYVRTI